MNLPDDILSNLNISLSRHKHPEKLDWREEKGTFVAIDGVRKFVVIEDENLGYVIAETKAISYGLGADAK